MGAAFQVDCFMADSYEKKITANINRSPTEHDITVSADCYPTNRWASLCFLQCRGMASHTRVLSTLGNGRARRNLFGPVDREQLQEEYQAALQKDLEEASNRWGFDFILEKPLESSEFQWEGVPGTKVPLLYRSSMLDQGQPERAVERVVMPKAGRAESLQGGKENVPCWPEKFELNLKSLEKTPEKMERTGLKRKQTNITGTALDTPDLNDSRCHFTWICMS